MKNLLFIAFLAAALVACKGTGKQPDQLEAVDSTEMVMVVPNCQVEIAIEGMTGTGCEDTIKAVIETLEGIAEVAASFETGMALVSFDTNLTSVGAMKEVIEQKGYTPLDHVVK